MSSAGEDDGSFALRCAWLLNPGQLPRPDVRITVEDGLVVDISDLPADEQSLVQPIAIVPSFVNAHTHLEFSQLKNPLPPPSPFTDWIRSVIGYRIQNSEAQQISDSIVSGLKQSAEGGVNLVGEITTSDSAVAALESNQVQAISFREFIGFRPEVVDAELESAFLLTRKKGKVPAGLSPHAPYSVHPNLFHGLVDIAAAKEWPVAMHLAETLDEIELLKNRSGRFVDFLSDMNLWEESTLGGIRSVLPYLQKLATCRRALAIHCNYLTADEIRFLGDNPNVAVTYCPRTHSWFGHSTHPFRKLLEAGATVILGTDSRASNPDLSVWRELQHVAGLDHSPNVWELLPMITTKAAEALGADPSDYSIRVGAKFDAVTLPCASRTSTTLNQTLVHADCQPQCVYQHGRAISKPSPQ